VSYAREPLKLAARALATVAVLPALFAFHLRALIVGRDRALQSSSQTLALLPGLTGQYLRRAFYCRTLAACHASTVIEFGCLLSKADARLGENAYIGPMSQLGLVDIERDVLIASGVQIPSGPLTHGIDDLDRPIRDQEGSPRRIRIGAGAWVGAGAVVLADVGAGAVVASGSVVTSPVPEGVIAGGVPARVLRARGAEQPAVSTPPSS
jgi:acetyltransferase-like isoleucine patch superfamily enzyme